MLTIKDRMKALRDLSDKAKNMEIALANAEYLSAEQLSAAETELLRALAACGYKEE